MLNGAEYDFNTAVVGNITLTAKWIATETSTISFASTEQRTSFSTTQQVWQQNGITVTNNKASSTSSVGNYSNPVRFYKNSEVIIEMVGMTKIEITCDSGSYATALKNSLTVDFTGSGSVVTITFASPVDSFTFTCTDSKIFIDSIAVTHQAEEIQGGDTEQPDEPEQPEQPEQPDEPVEKSWKLVTDVSELEVGAQVVIVAKDSNYAIGDTQNKNNRGQAIVTKSGNAVVIDENIVEVLTLEAGAVDGTFAFKTEGEDGYLYAASSSDNYLRTQTTNNANGSWKIEIAADGTATVKAQGANTRNILRYNSQSSLFSCYASGQKDICIYIYA